MTIHAVKFAFLRNRGSSEHVSSAGLFSCNFKVLENKLVTHFPIVKTITCETSQLGFQIHKK